MRDEFPHERDIRILIVPADTLFDYHCEAVFGDATANRARISQGLEIDVAIETLQHEYAHCLQFRNSPRFRVFHSDQWGKWYARCYRAVHGA